MKWFLLFLMNIMHECIYVCMDVRMYDTTECMRNGIPVILRIKFVRKFLSVWYLCI